MTRLCCWKGGMSDGNNSSCGNTGNRRCPYNKKHGEEQEEWEIAAVRL